MTTRKSNACRWPPTALSRSVIGTACALLLIASPCIAQPAAPAPGEELFLEVTLNGQPIDQLARFVRQPDGQLATTAATLRELGLRWPAGGAAPVALGQVPGLQVRYDGPRQRLALLAPVELLDRPVAQLSALAEAPGEADPAAPGLLLNYDLYGQQSPGLGTVSALTELRLFGLGPGVWSNTLISRASSGTNAAAGSDGSVRLDTAWQRDFSDRMVSLRLGDSVTGALGWSRALRFGGLHLARNFALQPYRVTTPLAQFQGSAVLPSTVDLFVNGLRQSSQQVAPGPFQLTSTPALNGTGQAQLVVTDITGQSRMVSYDLYGTPQLLQAGLSDWSLDIGAVRRDYGLRSAAYDGRLMASASLRHGWSDRTTVEAHAETTSGLQLAGLGGVWRLGGQGGVLSASLAGSRSDDGTGLRTGRQWGGGYQWSSPRFNVSLSTLRSGAGFRDVASLHGATLARTSDTAYFGLNGGAWGQLGLALIRLQQQDADSPTRIASLSWSYLLPGHASLNVSLNRSFGNAASSGTTLYVGWSMPLAPFVSVAASGRASREASSGLLEAARSVPSDAGGWGWRLQTGLGDTQGGLAQISQLGRYGQWTAGLSQWRTTGSPSTTIGYASASGSLVWMGGAAAPHALRRVDDAFAVVDTNGIPDVPVRLENRLIGHTDGMGLLFVTQLNAYQRNRLSIDTERLDPDVVTERTKAEAVPASRSGTRVHFPLHRLLAVQFALKDGAGQPLPVGSDVWWGDAPAGAPPLTVVGHEGIVYLENPAPGATIQAQTPAGRCRATLPALPSPSGLLDLGELACR